MGDRGITVVHEDHEDVVGFVIVEEGTTVIVVAGKEVAIGGGDDFGGA